MKPLAPIYEAMEKMCDRTSEDLIYLDDRAENITSGAARGWRAIQHNSALETKEALKAFDISV